MSIKQKELNRLGIINVDENYRVAFYDSINHDIKQVFPECFTDPLRIFKSDGLFCSLDFHNDSIVFKISEKKIGSHCKLSYCSGGHLPMLNCCKILRQKDEELYDKKLYNSKFNIEYVWKKDGRRFIEFEIKII